MKFITGKKAILNNQLGHLVKGTQVEIVEYSGDKVAFIVGDMGCIANVAYFDMVASVDKKPWIAEGPEHPESAEFAASKAKILHEKEMQRLREQNEGARKSLEKSKETEEAGKRFLGLQDKESATGVVCDECRKHGEVCTSCGFCGCYHSDEGNCMNADSRNHIREMEKKRNESTTESSLKTAVMKPNLDVAQDFLDSFKIPPTVVSDIMVQEFLQKENLHAAKNDLGEIYKILQSSGVEVRISLPKEEITAPTAAPAPEAIPTPKKKSALGNVLVDITEALANFHASDVYKAMTTGTLVETAKEDPTDTEEAMGLKVGSKVQYVVQSEDELPGIKPGTAVTGKIILMPIQHPEKDMSSGQPKEQGSTPIVTATVMWDREELGTTRGLLPAELVKVAGTKYTSEVTAPDGSKTVVEKEMDQDMGDAVKVKNPDGTETEYKKSSLTVEAKGENAKIRDLKKRLEKENKPAEITALINAIDALSGYVTKGKEAREKRRQDKANKAPAAEVAQADKEEVLAEATPSNLGEPNAGGDGLVADDESAQAAESPRGTIETTPEPMGDPVPPLKVETKEEECCVAVEPGFHNDDCPEHIEWLKTQKPVEVKLSNE